MYSFSPWVFGIIWIASFFILLFYVDPFAALFWLFGPFVISWFIARRQFNATIVQIRNDPRLRKLIERYPIRGTIWPTKLLMFDIWLQMDNPLHRSLSNEEIYPDLQEDLLIELTNFCDLSAIDPAVDESPRGRLRISPAKIKLAYIVSLWPSMGLPVDRSTLKAASLLLRTTECIAKKRGLLDNKRSM
jgi:hypothetical protein